MINIWEVTVQDLKKPYSFEKVRLIRTVDLPTAEKIYEQSIKHLHIAPGIVWASIPVEKHLGVVPRTYLYLEGLPL